MGVPCLSLHLFLLHHSWHLYSSTPGTFSAAKGIRSLPAWAGREKKRRQDAISSPSHTGIVGGSFAFPLSSSSRIGKSRMCAGAFGTGVEAAAGFPLCLPPPLSPRNISMWEGVGGSKEERGCLCLDNNSLVLCTC